MDGFPDLRQQPAPVPAPIQSTHEDLVVLEQQGDPHPGPPPLPPPPRFSANNMVSLAPNVPNPHSFGVPFKGVVNLGDRPWPASAPLPPPEVATLPFVGAFKPQVALLPPPPPPPLNLQHPSVGAPPPPHGLPVELVQQPAQQVQGPPSTVQPVSASSSQSSSMSAPPPPAQQPPFLAYHPFPSAMPWPAQGMPSPYAGYAPPPGMSGTAPLTPWSPPPLRHIDEWMGGTWTPGQASYPSSSLAQAPQPSTAASASDMSGHRRRGSSSVASTTTGPIEYPISAARSAAAHAAAEATRVAQVEHAAANAQYQQHQQQQQQQQQGGVDQASFSGSLGSFSMASMSGWPASYPSAQQVHQAQQQQQQQQAHLMQQQHLHQMHQMHAHAQMQHAHEQQQQQYLQHARQSSSPSLHAYSTTHTPPSDAGVDLRTSSGSPPPPATSPRAASPGLCAAAGCARPVFCELSPCGDRLCRDHLGWVIRGARTVEVDERASEGSGETATATAAPRTKKLFRCVACRVESSMAGPTTGASASAAVGASKGRRPSEPVVGLGLTGVDVPAAAAAREDDALHAFSIKYFSSGPAPFLHPSQPSPTSPSGGHEIDLSTALDPAGDASLVQHVRFPSSAPVGLELQQAPFAPSQAHPHPHQGRPGRAHGPAPALAPLNIELARTGLVGMQRVPRPPSPPFPVGSRFVGPEGTFLAEAQPFLFQAPSGSGSGQGAPQSFSPGVLTPTEKASSYGSEPGASFADHIDADEVVVRPSSAQPTLEGGSSSPITTTSPTTRRTHEHKRSLSRSVTSPAAMYAPNPLEAHLVAQLSAHDVPRRVPSPPESTGTPSPVHREGRALPPSSYPSPQASTAQTADRRGSLGHAMLQPDFAFPAPHHVLLQQQQQQQQQLRTPPRSFTQSTYLPSPYSSMPIPPMPPYASFPPGSVSVQPQHAQYPSMSGLNAFAPTFFGPVPSTPTQRGGGKKRGSLPAPQMVGIGLGGLPHWVERGAGASTAGGGGGGGSRGGISASATFPPRQAPTLDPMEDGAKLEQGGWPLVKVENIPFHTRVVDIEQWLPEGCLPSEEHCLQPIHIILHRATGRTLPHCYLEVVDIPRATDLIARMDRSHLGDRTVRVKWERPGELMRDLFAQAAYFQMGGSGPGGHAHLASPAAAPLPHLPPEGFRIPEVLLTTDDFVRLVGFTTRAIQFRERPFERSFYNVATLVNKFPWQREDLWDEAQRDDMFETVHQVLDKALELAQQDALFVRISDLIVKSGQACPAFTDEQKSTLSFALSQMLAIRASTPKKQRTSPSSTRSFALPFAPLPPNPHFASASPRTPQHGARSYASRMPMTPESPESPLVGLGLGGRAIPPHMGRGRGRYGQEYRRTTSFRNLGEGVTKVEVEVEGAAAESSVPDAEPQEEEAEEVEQGGGWVPLQQEVGTEGSAEAEGDVLSDGGNKTGSGTSSVDVDQGQEPTRLKSPSPSSTGPVERASSAGRGPSLVGKGTSGLHTPPDSPEMTRGGPTLVAEAVAAGEQ
ncbi:hypothetical protein JCM8208_004308 [Rhodotorula glutinis]